MKKLRFLIAFFIFNTITIAASEDSSYEYNEESHSDQNSSLEYTSDDDQWSKKRSKTKKNKLTNIKTNIKKNYNEKQCTPDYLEANFFYSNPESALKILDDFCRKNNPNYVSFSNQNNRNLVNMEKKSTMIDTEFQRNIIFFEIKNHTSNNTSSDDNQAIEEISSENKHIKKEDIIKLCKALRQHNFSAPLHELVRISFNKYKDLNQK